MAPTVTVVDLLRGGPEALRLGLELLGAEAGLEPTIIWPHVQITGVALANCRRYLHSEHARVFGESEVGYLESQDVVRYTQALLMAFSDNSPWMMTTGAWGVPAEVVGSLQRCHFSFLCRSVTTPMPAKDAGHTGLV